jgi:hypothetical protein
VYNVVIKKGWNVRGKRTKNLRFGYEIFTKNPAPQGIPSRYTIDA